MKIKEGDKLPDAKVFIIDIDKINDTILFGRESAGVPEKIHKLVDNRIKIPLKSGKRSLNIASSVAIVLAESMRQNKII